MTTYLFGSLFTGGYITQSFKTENEAFEYANGMTDGPTRVPIWKIEGAKKYAWFQEGWEGGSRGEGCIIYMKTEQKMILEDDEYEFYKKVNDLLKHGWKVVPTTLVISVGVDVIQSHWKPVFIERYAVVLELSI